MTSWRDGATQQAQADLDGLLTAALTFAQHLLAEHYEFYPFAAAVTRNGDVELIAGGPPGSAADHPSSASVLEGCELTLQSRQKDLRSSALIADVTTPTGDAVQVDLNHVEGHSLRVLLPYTRHRLGRVNEYGDLRASMGVWRLWNDRQT